MAEAGAFLEEFSEEEKAKLAQLEFAVVVLGHAVEPMPCAGWSARTPA